MNIKVGKWDDILDDGKNIAKVVECLIGVGAAVCTACICASKAADRIKIIKMKQEDPESYWKMKIKSIIKNDSKGLNLIG